MKKFQKTISTEPVKTQCSANDKPQTDFIALLPKIIKILPQLGINIPFLKPQQPPSPPSHNVKPASLMKEENHKVVVNSMQNHVERVKKIKTETDKKPL